MVAPTTEPMAIPTFLPVSAFDAPETPLWEYSIAPEFTKVDPELVPEDEVDPVFNLSKTPVIGIERSIKSANSLYVASGLL